MEELKLIVFIGTGTLVPYKYSSISAGNLSILLTSIPNIQMSFISIAIRKNHLPDTSARSVGIVSRINIHTITHVG